MTTPPTLTRHLTPSRRRWIYGAAIAVLPLLIAYGVIDDSTAALWAAVIGAVLVPGLALGHVTDDDIAPYSGW